MSSKRTLLAGCVLLFVTACGDTSTKSFGDDCAATAICHAGKHGDLCDPYKDADFITQCAFDNRTRYSCDNGTWLEILGQQCPLDGGDDAAD